MTATQDDTIAKLQRTVAELRRDRDVAQTRTTANMASGSSISPPPLMC
jgi:uncharacterized coiled-coil protein SlyX